MLYTRLHIQVVIDIYDAKTELLFQMYVLLYDPHPQVSFNAELCSQPGSGCFAAQFCRW